MFYSQFILAKKGPLGTIWIAAHLERKLRKNQVADTDIGVSVDSILSPDVPIALRLSSHLLLGVVRIYSRKVNYLFDDCSEALLKIKQAFRSAAVDLPPEESKAPYHSITLPETFDLDDFELPDNEIFHGDFVDHHISSREQITLQDTMEGVSYSTSKFGLDERFGDGDASGLDLDEELFLDKSGTTGHGNESADLQVSIASMTPLKQDEHPETMTVSSGTRVDLAEVCGDLMDYAQAPCTPGLVDKPNLSNVQEVSACDDHVESEYHLVEPSMKENATNTYEDKQEVNCCSGNSKNSDAIPLVLTEENGFRSGGSDINLPKPQGEFPIEANVGHVSVDESSSGSKPTSDSLDQVKVLNTALKSADKVIEASDVPCTEGLSNGSVNKDDNYSFPVDEPCGDHQGAYRMGLEKSACEISGVTSSCQQVSGGLSAKDRGLLGVEVPGSVETADDQEKSSGNAFPLASENQDGSSPQNPDTQAPHSSLLNLDVHEKVASAETQFILPCKSNIQRPDSGCGSSIDVDVQPDVAVLATYVGEEMVMQGKSCSVTGCPEEILKENHMQIDVHAASIEPVGQAHITTSHDRLEKNLDKSAEAELPPPEKLLSVPEGLMDQHQNILIEGSPEDFVGLPEGDAGSKILSGKKRSFTESTLTEQSLNSVESSRLGHSKRKVGSVPDDNDLLSSILVGRSSVLKVKPTPRLSEATSMKRTRTASRTGAPKRKVPMDDTMVLHGDMIRKQLINTEDIRRVRKKAPCTLPEMSVIQKQYFEDEIFLEQICTGMSVQLSSLHSQMWDVSGISVCKNDLNCGSLQVGAEPGIPSENDKSDVPHDVKNDDSLEIAAEPHLTSQSAENHQCPDAKIEKGSAGPDVIEQSGERITDEALLDGDSKVAEHCENPMLSDSLLKEFSEKNTGKEQTQATSDVHADLSQRVLSLGETAVEISQKNDDVVNSSVIAGVKSPDSAEDASGNMLDTAAGLVQADSITETSETNPWVKADASAVLPDKKMDVPSVELDSVMINADSEQTINKHLPMEKDSDIDAVVETEHVLSDDFQSRVVRDGGIVDLPPISEHEPIVSSLYPSEIGLVDDVFMNDIAQPEQPEAYHSYMIDADPGFDLHNREELKYSTTGNDTEFLNVDDDELTEIVDDHIPDDEEAQFTENTGWSSRTRAVSKYLQTLFTKEPECGRKSLSMDNLLIRKSRKEASRMFFEALVLKTRDYINVEQRNPFDDITIKPRTRLMKSDF